MQAHAYIADSQIGNTGRAMVSYMDTAYSYWWAHYAKARLFEVYYRLLSHWPAETHDKKTCCLRTQVTTAGMRGLGLFGLFAAGGQIRLSTRKELPWHCCLLIGHHLLEVLLHVANGLDVPVLHQHVEHVGRNERRQIWAEAAEEGKVAKRFKLQLAGSKLCALA